MNKEKKNNKDELSKLLEEMRADNSMPSDVFEQKLKSKLIGEKGYQSLLTNTRSLLNFRMGLAIHIIILLFPFVVILGAVSSYFYFSTPNSQKDQVVLNKVQKSEFLSSVIENNPQGLLNSNLITSSNIVANNSLIKDIRAEKLVAEATQKTYSFSSTINKIEVGPAHKICNLYGDIKSSINNYYEFVNGEGFYVKNIDTRENGDLISYYLITGNEYIYFQGGKYAIKQAFNDTFIDTIFKENPDTVDTEKTTSDPVAEYFGKVVEIERVEDNTYLLSYESEIVCNFAGTYVDNTNIDLPRKKLIYRHYINGTNYEVLRSEQYIDSVSKENLLITQEIKTEKSKKIFEEVASVFTFGYDVEVRDTDSTNFFKLYENTMDYLAKNSVKLLTFSDKNTIFSGIDVPILFQNQYNPAYLTDRDFYPEGEEGDRLYNKALETYSMKTKNVVPEFYVQYADNDNIYNVDYYNKTYTAEDILNESITRIPGQNSSEISIKINGDNIKADYYSEEIDCNTYPDCQDGMLYHYIIFNFDRYRILLSVPSSEPLSSFIDKLTFSTLDIKKDKDYILIDSVLRKNIEGKENEPIPMIF